MPAPIYTYICVYISILYIHVYKYLLYIGYSLFGDFSYFLTYFDTILCPVYYPVSLLGNILLTAQIQTVMIEYIINYSKREK